MDNLLQYGFQPYRWLKGPNYLTKLPASGASFDVTGGAQNVGIWPGDVLVDAADQGLALCAGAETTQVSPAYIAMGTEFQWDATQGKMMLKHSLSDGIAYSLAQRAGKVFVARVEDAIWSVAVDDIVTATTRAAYQALVGLNVDFKNCGASGELKANPRLHITGAATTNTLKWRLIGIDPTRDNRDFAGAYVRMLVTINIADSPAWGGTTGV
jgi:hypothetical protein